MALHLKDLMAKAESRGIKAKEPSPAHFLKPWQEESVLFNQNTTTKNQLPSEKTTAQPKNSVKNRQQSDNILATNRQQSDNRSDNKLATNRQQKNKTGNKLASQPATEVTTKRQQSDNKATTNWHFSELTGLQKALVEFIYKECKISRSKTTGNLTLEYISSATNHPKGSIKTTLQRLEQKKFIQRDTYKNGRGGWSRYSLQDNIFRDLLQHETDNKLATNWQQNDNKVASQPATEPATSPLSSSSIYNITTTTELPKEWLEIDYSALSSIGFSQHHLTQLYRTNEFEPKHIQNSIEHFAFDLSKNNKASEIKTNPLGYFMGIMKRSGVYTAPENYEAPKDKAMRIYIEQQKTIQKKREEMENELFDVYFSDWQNQLSESDKNNLISEDAKQSGLQGAKVSSLKKYYRDNIWVEKRSNVLKNIDKHKDN